MTTMVCPICKSVVGGVMDERTVDYYTRCWNCHIILKYDVKTGQVTEDKQNFREVKGTLMTRSDYVE